MTVREPLAPAPYSLWLDLFRWIAAWLVVQSHAGGIFILPLSYVPAGQRPLLGYPYSFLGGFGHYAVIVFFVLSGFLVGGSWIRDKAKGRASVSVYMSKRIVRLGIVLFPTLIISALLVQWAIVIYPGSDGTGIYGAERFVSAQAPTLACNAVFLQNVFCQQAAGNASLWSLTHEFWYYVAFPLLVSGRKGAVAGIALLGALTYMQVSAAPILPYFVIWLAGVAVAVAPHRSLSIPFTAALFLIAVVVARLAFKDDGGFWIDLGVAASLSALLLAMKSKATLRPPPFPRIHGVLAGFSYTLYCVHIPVMLFLSSICVALFGRGYRTIASSWFDWAILLCGICMTIVIAYLFSRVTEAHTDQVRKWIYGWAGKSAAALRLKRMPRS